MKFWLDLGSALLAASIASASAHAQGNSVVYRCPGNVYTDSISAKDAQEKGCRTIEGAPVTVIQTTRPREGKSVPAASVPRLSESRGNGRVDQNEQRLRDSDARRILEAELKTETDRLAALQREYNSGEPERRGDERNYQKYLDRVAEMKAGIARKESDIAALKRELAKLPQ